MEPQNLGAAKRHLRGAHDALERVMDELRDANQEAARLRSALETMVVAADNGEWHNSDDCRVEGRAADCVLCQTLIAARTVLGAQPIPPGTCSRCGAPLNNVSPGFSATSSGLVCALCLGSDEEIARARSL
jgi:hypothetical protein